MKRFFCVLLAICFSCKAFAGFDVFGKIKSVQLKDGALYFSFSNRSADVYCKVGWDNLSFYVPADHKDYPYYYGLITTANIHKQNVRIANINVFDGTTACDITKTGYGLVVFAP